MIIFALNVKTDHKQTVVNKITLNLFPTTKFQKKKILTLTKE